MFDNTLLPSLQRKLEIEIEAARQQIAESLVRAAKLTAQKQEQALEGLIRGHRINKIKE